MCANDYAITIFEMYVCLVNCDWQDGGFLARVSTKMYTFLTISVDNNFKRLQRLGTRFLGNESPIQKTFGTRFVTN